jgi:hypothetical protein
VQQIRAEQDNVPRAIIIYSISNNALPAAIDNNRQLELMVKVPSGRELRTHSFECDDGRVVVQDLFKVRLHRGLPSALCIGAKYHTPAGGRAIETHVEGRKRFAASVQTAMASSIAAGTGWSGAKR